MPLYMPQSPPGIYVSQTRKIILSDGIIFFISFMKFISSIHTKEPLHAAIFAFVLSVTIRNKSRSLYLYDFV